MILALIHGILTDQTDASWPDDFDAWLFKTTSAVKVIKKEYSAGATPKLNCFWRDPIIAQSLANEIELFAFENNQWRLQVGSRLPPIWFVCHSNGCVIGLRAVERLIADGFDVAGIIFFGGAIHSDVDRNGLWRLMHPRDSKSARLQRAYAISNPGDHTVPHKADPADGLYARVMRGLWRCLAWPYGGLGHEGWTRKGQPFGDDRTFTVWKPASYGHSGYFTRANRESTYREILQLMQRHAL